MSPAYPRQNEYVLVEGMCYGPLHPHGKRLPASAFLPDPRRANELSEFCEPCVMERGREASGVTVQVAPKPIQPKEKTSMNITCNKCGVEKSANEYYGKSKQCRRCVLDRQKAAKAAKAGKPVPKFQPDPIAKAKPVAAKPEVKAAPAGEKPLDLSNDSRVLEILIIAGHVSIETVNQVQAFVAGSK